MTNIPEPYYTQLQADAYLQYKTAAGRNQVRPEGIAVLMMDGTIFPGRSNEQAGINAAEDAIGHLTASFNDATVGADPAGKHVAAVVIMTNSLPEEEKPQDPTEDCLNYLRAYPGIGTCGPVHVVASHIEASFDLKL